MDLGSMGEVKERSWVSEKFMAVCHLNDGTCVHVAVCNKKVQTLHFGSHYVISAGCKSEIIMQWIIKFLMDTTTI